MKALPTILFFLIATFAAAQARDTTVGNWTGKWDPNDPNCPCYDIQKQAEREYQELLKKEKMGEEYAGPEVTENTGSVNTGDVKTEENTLSKEGQKQLRKAQKKSRKGKEKKERKKKKKGKVICPGA